MSGNLFSGLSFLEVIERLQTDKQFSNLFEAIALRVAVNGLDSPDGRRLLMFFAKDEEELARLVAETETLEGILAVNRRNTVEGTATPGTGTTGTTGICLAAGLREDGTERES